MAYVNFKGVGVEKSYEGNKKNDTLEQDVEATAVRNK